MQIVPFEAAHLFDFNAAILGWLLAAVLPKKQHPRNNNILSGIMIFCREIQPFFSKIYFCDLGVRFG
jgi:hypothetical protein